MEIYIIVFGICIILAYLIPRFEEKKYLKYILLIIIILLLSALGGCRDNTIGIDVEVYGRAYFEKACKYENLVEYVNSIKNMDKGYLVLNYAISRITNNVNILLFILQLITNTLVIVTLYKHRKKMPFWLSILAFLSIYYLKTYNFLRQSIALAIIFFGINYIENRKVFPYLICIALAFTFHYTALVAIILYPLYWMLSKNKKVYNYIIVIGLVLLVIITFNILNVMDILYDLGIINDKIYNYTDEYLNDNPSINKTETLFRMFFIALYALIFNKINGKDSINKFLFVCLVLDIILYQFGIFMSFAYRIAMYFGYFIILIIPQLPDNLAFTYRNRVIMKAVISIILIVYCYYEFVQKGTCEVYPYTSEILNIGF